MSQLIFTYRSLVCTPRFSKLGALKIELSSSMPLFFPECVAKGSRFTFGGLGVHTCSRDPAFGVRNPPRATVVRVKLACLWGKPQKRVFLDVAVVCSCRFAWQAWHPVTFDVFQEECVCARPSWQKSCPVYGESHQNVSFYTVDFTLHCPLYTLSWHFTLNTPLFTLHTPLHTLHCTLYTSHFTLHTPHFTLHIYN